MKSAFRLSILGLSAFLLSSSPAFAADAKEMAGFGVMRAPAADVVKAQAQDWLRKINKTDAATQQAFKVIWESEERTLLDKVTETFVLGSPDAAKLLKEARDADASAPKEVPAIFKDTNQSNFFRANLGLAYGKALSSRRVYEECLETLKTVRPEAVVDPASYFFHRAVAEHALILKAEAEQSIIRLDDVADAPERYKRVAGLMYADLQGWKVKMDLGHVGRLMGNVERRLDLARGGPETQKTEREIIHRLDEIIKQLEKKQQGGGGNSGSGGEANGGACPGGSGSGDGSGDGSGQSSQGKKDSTPGSDRGPGVVDNKELQNKAENWGKLPAKERTSAKADMVRSLPNTNRQQIEDYYRRIGQGDNK